MDKLDKESRRRYSRNIMLPEVGEEGQRKLLSSSVLIVGCGALGNIVAQYLSASGVGRIGLVDFDTVDISNLQRQLSFDMSDLGKKKAAVLADRLVKVNPATKIDIYDAVLSRHNANSIIRNYDMIVEGSDNPETKYLVDSVCRAECKPYVMGGINRYDGQVFTYLPGNSSYIDFFPTPAAHDAYTPCSLGGVLGPLPGVVASIQACEVIKYLTHIGDLLVDRLLLIDAFTMTFTTLSI